MLAGALLVMGVSILALSATGDWYLYKQMSVTPPAIDNTRLTGRNATPVLKSAAGFADAEGAINNWFVNGVSIDTFRSVLYNADGTIPAADFVNGHIIVATTALTTPTAQEIFDYLDQTRLHTSAAGVGAPGATVVGALPSFRVYLAHTATEEVIGDLTLTAGTNVVFQGGSPFVLTEDEIVVLECFLEVQTGVNRVVVYPNYISTLPSAPPAPPLPADPYYLSAEKSGNQLAPNDNTANDITSWAITTERQAGPFDAGTGVFTVPASATYRLSLRVEVRPDVLNAPTGSYNLLQAAIYNNATASFIAVTEAILREISGEASNSSESIYVEHIVALTAGQTITARIYNSSVSTEDVDVVFGDRTTFVIEEIWNTRT